MPPKEERDDSTAGRQYQDRRGPMRSPHAPMLTVLPRHCPGALPSGASRASDRRRATAYATVAFHRTVGHRDRATAHALRRTERPALPLQVDALRARRSGGPCPATRERNIPSRPSDDGPRRARRHTPLEARCARDVRAAPAHRLRKPARGRGWIGDSDRRAAGRAQAEPSQTPPLDHSAIAVESSPSTITQRPLLGAVVMALMAPRNRSTAPPSHRQPGATTGELGCQHRDSGAPGRARRASRRSALALAGGTNGH
jgi:hypothetical protein